MRTAILPTLALAAALLAAPAGDAPALGKLKGKMEPVSTDADVSLWGVTAFSAEDVRICGSEGTYVTTTDGKEFKVRQIDEDVSLRLMYWHDRSNGYFAVRKDKKNELFTTTDGGRRFLRRKIDLPFPIEGITFLDRKRGWLVAGSKKESDGAWQKTTDGGITWKEPDANDYRIPARELHGISAPGAEQIWAVGSHVSVTLVGEPAKSPIYKARKGSVLHSKNRGADWEVQDAGNSADTVLFDVDFVDDSVGYVVGDMGFAAKTTDGGKTWTALDTGLAAKLLAVDAVSADLVFAVGEDGAAVGSGDGGKSFSTFPADTKCDLRDCSFVDDKTGYAVGQRGTILKFARTW